MTAVRCSNRLSIFNTGIDSNPLCTDLDDIPSCTPAVILCNNPTADDSSILHNDVNDQRDLCSDHTADDSLILHNEVNGQHHSNIPTADDRSILHNEVNDQHDLSNNPTADVSSILHDEVNDQHDLKSLSNIISKPGLKIGCLNIIGVMGKIDEIRAILKSCQFDVFCRCETSIDLNVCNDEIDIHGYSIDLCNRTRHGRGRCSNVRER